MIDITVTVDLENQRAGIVLAPGGNAEEQEAGESLGAMLTDFMRLVLSDELDAYFGLWLAEKARTARVVYPHPPEMPPNVGGIIILGGGDNMTLEDLPPEVREFIQRVAGGIAGKMNTNTAPPEAQPPIDVTALWPKKPPAPEERKDGE